MMKIKAGDVVYHRPTGEEWLAVTDEERGTFFAGGWPETLAYASDCDIITVATEEENLRWLKECSEGSGSSMRELVARRQYKERIVL